MKHYKGERVWLQLMRGNILETSNIKTGYTSFSGTGSLLSSLANAVFQSFSHACNVGF